MNLVSITPSRLVTYERFYRVLFYLLCISLLVSSVIKFGGALNKTKIGIGDIKFRLDHILHAVAYFIFSMYYIFGQYFGLKLFKNHQHTFFFLALFSVGLLAEAIQILVPWRSFSLLDMLSNLVGIGAGYGVTIFMARKLNGGITV